MATLAMVKNLAVLEDFLLGFFSRPDEGEVGTGADQLLVLSVAWRGVSVPLLWTALVQESPASTEERTALMARFLALFPVERIVCLTVDREFRAHRWLAYLMKRRIPFRLRIPNNTLTHNRHRNARLPVPRLFAVRMGQTRVLSRPRRLWGHTLYRVGTRVARGERVIVTPPMRPKAPLRTIAKGGKQMPVRGDEAPGV